MGVFLPCTVYLGGLMGVLLPYSLPGWPYGCAPSMYSLPG